MDKQGQNNDKPDAGQNIESTGKNPCKKQKRQLSEKCRVKTLKHDLSPLRDIFPGVVIGLDCILPEHRAAVNTLGWKIFFCPVIRNMTIRSFDLAVRPH